MSRRRITVGTFSFVLMAAIAGGLFAQRGPGRGRGPGGPGFRGGRQDPKFQEDHEAIHFLLDNGKKIRRTVKNLKNGIETVTESDDPDIAGKIQEHVSAMYDRLEEKRPIRMRDPLFRALFSNTDKIKMKLEETEKGVRVVETSKDPYVAKLLQEHAKVVSLFIKNGRAEAHKNHALPSRNGKPAAKAAPAAACCGKGAACCKDGKCKDGKCKDDKCKDGKCKDGKCKDGKCKNGKCKLEPAKPAKPCCKAKDAKAAK